MASKTIKFNKSGIESLPDEKPVVYEIQTETGKANYVGVAKRGRVQERIGEHIGDVPGTKVKIEQYGTIDDARKKEQKAIHRKSPRYNKKGK